MIDAIRLETWSRWYPFDVEPTADEWKAVHSLAPVPAVQRIKRQRMIDSGNKDDGKKVNHPTLEEVAAVSVYKDSLQHQQQIKLFNDTAKEIREDFAKEMVILSNHQSGKTIQLDKERKMHNAASTQRRSNVAQSNGRARGNIRSTRSNKKKRK